MILNNNPAIDVDALMQRVRAQAQELRAGGAIERRRGESRTPADIDLARSLDTQRIIAAHLSAGDAANLPVDVPRRLRSLGPLGRLLARVLNYLFKRQREYNASLLAANRELLAMQVAIGESVASAIQDIAAVKGAPAELRSAIDGLAAHVAEIRSLAEHAAKHADFSHERVDSSETDIRAISNRLAHVVERADVDIARLDDLIRNVQLRGDRLEHVSARVDFAHERIDSGESTLRELPSRGEMRLSIVDASRELEHRIAGTYESMLRSLAILRGEMRAAERPVPDASTSAQGGEADVDDAVHALISDRFRGSRAEIDERLGVYLPLIRAAQTVGEAAPLLDVGPGRGEWLARLKREDIPARGVETNQLLADECRIQGLDVETSDMLGVLRAGASGSLGAITAFHVVEHLPFAYLVDALREALRVLVPGGVLIFETPDPRNLIVASQTFYFDPTHLHPVPRELLQTLLEGLGFVDCAVLELHPPAQPAFAGDDAISQRLNTFFSAPLDYAIVARAPRA